MVNLDDWKVFISTLQDSLDRSPNFPAKLDVTKNLSTETNRTEHIDFEQLSVDLDIDVGKRCSLTATNVKNNDIQSLEVRQHFRHQTLVSFGVSDIKT